MSNKKREGARTWNECLCGPSPFQGSQRLHYHHNKQMAATTFASLTAKLAAEQGITTEAKHVAVEGEILLNNFCFFHLIL